VLHAAEASPGGRLVRERLSVLEWPYVLRPCGVGGVNRAALRNATGSASPCFESGDERTSGAHAILDRLAAQR
jgi:hypothetical protein